MVVDHSNDLRRARERTIALLNGELDRLEADVAAGKPLDLPRAHRIVRSVSVLTRAASTSTEELALDKPAEPSDILERLEQAHRDTHAA